MSQQNNQITDRLTRAASHIDAVDLGDDRWAHYDDATRRWWVCSADELVDLADYLDHEDDDIRRDAYSHWCAGTTPEEMPDGWEPGDADDARAITDDQIRQLRTESAAAGDADMVADCDAALAGDTEARESCQRTIDAARAMDDSDA